MGSDFAPCYVGDGGGGLRRPAAAFFPAVEPSEPKSGSWPRAAAAWTRAIVRTSTFGSATGTNRTYPNHFDGDSTISTWYSVRNLLGATRTVF